MFRRRQSSGRPVASAIGFLKSPVELLERRLLLAADGVVLQSGRTYEGTIPSPTAVDRYVFTAAAGDTAAISFAGTASIGPQFELYGPTGTLIDQKFYEDTLRYTNLAAGTYTVRLRDRADIFRDDCDYALTFVKLPGAHQLGAGEGSLTNGQTKFGEIDRGDIDIYTFNAAAGATATIAFRGNGTLGPQIELFGPNGRLISEVHYSGEGRFGNLAAGTHTILVRDFVDNFGPTNAYRIDFLLSGGSTTPAPTVSVAVNAPTVLENGPGVLRYTFTRTGSTANALTVNFQTSGTATAGNDYVATGATAVSGGVRKITFSPGQATAVFVVSPTDDAVVEPNETVRVDIAAGAGYTVGTPSGVVAQIVNDDSAAAARVTVAVSSPTVQEDGPGVLRYTFTRTSSTANALTVNFRVSGTAVAGNDYFTSGATPVSGGVRKITFSPGQATAVFIVSPADDRIVEPHENVRVDLAAGVGYTLGSPAFAGAQILNDDAAAVNVAVNVTVDKPTVNEDGPGVLRYTFTRSGSTAGGLTVNFRVSGTAVAGNDYFTAGARGFNGRSGQIVFASGQATAVFVVSPADDAVAEPHENVRVDIAAGTGYTIGTRSGVGAQILNDDTATAAGVIDWLEMSDAALINRSA